MRTYLGLATVVTFLLATCVDLRSNEDGAQSGAAIALKYKSSYLRVEGARLVAQDGHEVELHGINIGGWLVTEDWMCGFADYKDTAVTSGSGGTAGRSALESLEDRFGAENAAALMNVWQDHWFTSKDLDEIHEGGFNLIRVPISFRTLQHADGSWIMTPNGQIDFRRMDWVVREAARRGIYTIFDLHVWPEQRNAYDHIGRPGGRYIRESMSRLWETIAQHYRGDGAIAAFDLINEFPGNWGVQQQLSRAVREGDPDRVQVVEGYTFQEFLKLHKAGEFPNSIFSEHLYAADAMSTEELKSHLKETLQSPVPIYIGEFLAADFGAATQAMNRSRISWSAWTYKAVNMGNWGAFNYYSNVKTNIQQDTLQAINAKWSTDLVSWEIPGSPRNYFLNEDRRFAGGSEQGTSLSE